MSYAVSDDEDYDENEEDENDEHDEDYEDDPETIVSTNDNYSRSSNNQRTTPSFESAEQTSDRIDSKIRTLQSFGLAGGEGGRGLSSSAVEYPPQRQSQVVHHHHQHHQQQQGGKRRMSRGYRHRPK